MGEPMVLLVDEPTSMLDHTRGYAIVDLLASRCAEYDSSGLVDAPAVLTEITVPTEA